MRNMVRLNLYGKSSLIESKEINISVWYDGDVKEIDSDGYRAARGITSIEGTQYNNKGEIEEKWTTYYDDLGRLIKSERYDSSSKLIDLEEIKYDENGRIVR